jgi:hypothetical protein
MKSVTEEMGKIKEAFEKDCEVSPQELILLLFCCGQGTEKCYEIYIFKRSKFSSQVKCSIVKRKTNINQYLSSLLLNCLVVSIDSRQNMLHTEGRKFVRDAEQGGALPLANTRKIL